MADENIKNAFQGWGVGELSTEVSKLQSSEIERANLQYKWGVFNKTHRQRQDEFEKTLSQQKSTIIWVRWLGVGWLVFVISAFLALSGFILPQDSSSCVDSSNTSFLGASSVAIALIASGTSAAVIGPMLVAYAVFRKKSPTGSLLGSAAEMTKEDSS